MSEVTHDGSGVATPGRWRLLSGDRRRVRVTVAPVDEADLHLACQQMVDNAENRLLGARATLDAVLDRTRHPHFGAVLTREELVSLFRDYLLEIYAVVIGVKTS